MNLTIIAALISAAMAGLAGWGAAWTIQGRAIDTLKMEAKDAIISQQRAARAVTDRLTSQITQAQNQAVIRNDRNRADALVAGDAGNGLRVAAAAATGAAHASADACNSVVTAYGVILDEGREVIREMATDLDRCYSERQTLTDAWPR